MILLSNYKNMSTNSLLTINDWLICSQKSLSLKDISSSRIDCLIILGYVLDLSKVNILANPDRLLSKQEVGKLDRLLKLRADRTPIAYLTNKKEFYRRDFYVDHRVLIPRHETEEIIDQVLKLDMDETSKIADIGTGSGCIGITLALEIPNSQVDLYDISDDAITVAQINAATYCPSINIRKSDLLANISQEYDLIVCNLPYVPTNLNVSPEIKFEPQLAVFAENNGMSVYVNFWNQVKGLSKRPKYIICESLEIQHNDNISMANAAGYEFINTSNLTQLFILKV